jgi:hypothetical protein
MQQSRTKFPVISFALLVLAACGSGGHEGGTQLVYSFGSATQITVDDVELTLEIRAEGLSEVDVVSPVSLMAVRDGDVFRIWSLPLAPGDNTVRLRALADSGAPFEQVLVVHNAALPRPAARLVFEPLTCEPGVPVRARVLVAAGLGAPTEILVDEDRDGIVERHLTSNDELSFTFFEPGLYEPRVAVRTAHGMLHASNELFTPTIRCLEPLPSAPDWMPPQALPALVDIAWSPLTGAPVVLSSHTRSVYFLNRTGRVALQRPAAGCVTPVGLSISASGDVLIADSGGNRVVRLAAAAGYALDSSFGAGGIVGEAGDGPGQFASPSDVAVLVDLASGAQRIVVSDTGNHRLQVLDEHGAFLAASTEAGGGHLLEAPTQLASDGPEVVAVIDSGPRRLCVFALRGAALAAITDGFANVSALEVTSLHGDPHSGGFLVGESAHKRLHVLGPLGSIRRIVEVAAPFTGGLLVGDDPETRLVLTGESGLVGYTWRDDPRDQGPEDSARRAIQRILVGDLDDTLLDPEFAAQLADQLADPASGPTLLESLTQLRTFRCESRSGDYALIAAFSGDPNSEPNSVVAMKRSALTGSWLLLHL